MKQEHNNYIIYKAVNTENNKVYIGATTSSVENRKQDHLKKSRNGEVTKFYDSISTYGSNAFNWGQVDTASSVDELAQKEKQYVLEYKSKENGYNSDVGGGFKKTIYQYNLVDGKLLNTYFSLSDAGNVVNATKQSISAACLSVNKTFRGFYWSYEFPFNINIDKRFKGVEQLDNDGEVVAEYKSIAEASKFTGVNKSSIAKVCREERKQAGGYYWRNIGKF